MADREPNRSKTSRFGRISKMASLWVLLFLVPVVLLNVMGAREQGSELTYTEFNRQLERGNVAEVVFIEGSAIEGALREPIGGEPNVSISRFQTELPVRDSEALLARLEASGVPIGARQADRDWWAALLGFLPWVLIIGFWIFIARQMQAGGAKAFQFGKSKA